MEVFLAPLIAILSTSNIPLAACLLLVFLLIVDRQRMIRDARRMEDRLNKIVDDALAGQTTIADALNSLRMLLAEIRGKL